jgi:large subunit ribosomal protein L41
MSFNFLLRAPSITNNIVQDTLRKRKGLSFRKTLGVYNYKVKPRHYYKNPHAIPLHIKEQHKTNENTDYGIRKIRALENNSLTPYGKISSKGHFKMNYSQVPEYNVPDLTDFPVKYFFYF